MSDMGEAHPASWYIVQGIKDIESIPQCVRDGMAIEADDQDARMDELDRRLRIMDTKYNELLGIMHALGDRIQTATDALVESTKERP
jgi:low affinity Fe/Cu permease